MTDGTPSAACWVLGSTKDTAARTTACYLVMDGWLEIQAGLNGACWKRTMSWLLMLKCGGDSLLMDAKSRLLEVIAPVKPVG